uniref:Chitin-binding type-2 domain-containing protein n=1 Tax=Strongyloides papillosus TaxID=174720 RepID=A0A0N5BF13_STREA
MHHFIQLLNVLNIGSNLSASTCPLSSYTNVAKCYESYFNYFNLTIGPNLEFPDYQTFIASRAKLETNTEISNFLNACDIQNTLVGCLDTDDFCLNPEDLSKIGKFKNNDNFLYAGDYNMVTYECTTGYDYVINNYYCIINTNYLFQDQFANCTSTYMKNIPIEGECPATNNFINCYDTIYSTNCGEKAGDFYCNVLTRGLNTELPVCNGKLMTCNPL